MIAPLAISQANNSLLAASSGADGPVLLSATERDKSIANIKDYGSTKDVNSGKLTQVGFPIQNFGLT